MIYRNSIFLLLYFFSPLKIYSHTIVKGNNKLHFVAKDFGKIDKLKIKGFFKLIFIYHENENSRIEINAEKNLLPYIYQKYNAKKKELDIEIKDLNFSNTIVYYNGKSYKYQSHPKLEEEMELRTTNPDINLKEDSNDLLEIHLNTPIIIKIYLNQLRNVSAHGDVNAFWETNNLGTLWKLGELKIELHNHSNMNCIIDSRIINLKLFDKSQIHIKNLSTGNMDLRVKDQSRIIIANIDNKNTINSMTLQAFDMGLISIPYCSVRQSSIRCSKNSHINIQKLDGDYCKFDIIEMGKVSIKGTTKTSDITLRDNAKLIAPKFIINEANVLMHDYSFSDIQILNPKIIQKSNTARLLNRRFPIQKQLLGGD